MIKTIKDDLTSISMRLTTDIWMFKARFKVGGEPPASRKRIGSNRCKIVGECEGDESHGAQWEPRFSIRAVRSGARQNGGPSV